MLETQASHAGQQAGTHCGHERLQETQAAVSETRCGNASKKQGEMIVIECTPEPLTET